MLALCDRARNHEIAPSDSKNIFQKYNRMTTAFANPSELILDTLNNIDLESKLKGYALSLGSLSLASGTTQFNSSYEDVKIVNTQILLAGKNAKANYYALREKELVVMINVIGVLLFSAVVMFMVVHFPQHAWWLTMIVSGLAIGGICLRARDRTTSGIGAARPGEADAIRTGQVIRKTELKNIWALVGFRIDLSSSVAYAYPLTRVWTWNLGDSNCAPLCHEHNPIKLH